MSDLNGDSSNKHARNISKELPKIDSNELSFDTKEVHKLKI